MTIAPVILLSIQVMTFLALGAIFAATGNVRLGIAQVLLAFVQLVVYSGGITR